MGERETALEAACTLHNSLCAGWAFPEVPPPVPGLLREQGEHAVGVFGSAVGRRIGYESFRCADVTVTSGGPQVVFGSPQFVAGYAVTSVLMQRRARKRARRLAQPQWRARPMTCAVVTTHRLWCAFPDQGWGWFNYDTVADLRLDDGVLVMSFIGDAPPVRLTGPWAPWIAVAIAHRAFGTTAAAHMPWLTRLYTMARALA